MWKIKIPPKTHFFIENCRFRMSHYHHNHLKDKRYFEKIPIEARKKWIQKMARTPQIPQEVPKLYFASHDEPTNPFQYKKWKLNYHKV